MSKKQSVNLHDKFFKSVFSRREEAIVLKRMLFEEGTIEVEGGNINNHKYNYFIKDHLGNTRVVVSPDETGDGKPEISQTAHYYPFGMNFQRPTDNHNRRLYNSKELQTELDIDWYDYEARFYDASLGRWATGIDPLAEKYYSLSPYNYCANNPINFIDPNGMELVAAGSFDDILRLLNIIATGVEGRYSVKATQNDDGNFSISFGDAVKGKPISRHSRAFHKYMSEVIDDDFTTNISVMSDTKKADVGSYDTGIVDVADIEQFPKSERFGENTVGTQQGKLIHEVYEQFLKQKNFLPSIDEDKNAYLDAHNQALNVEGNVDGLQRIPFNEDNNNYIPPNQYGKGTVDNNVGRRTKYYNPATGTIYIENVYLKHDLLNRRATIKYGKVQKIK